MSKSAFSVKSVLLIKREDKTVGQKTKGSQYVSQLQQCKGCLLCVNVIYVAFVQPHIKQENTFYHRHEKLGPLCFCRAIFSLLQQLQPPLQISRCTQYTTASTSESIGEFPTALGVGFFSPPPCWGDLINICTTRPFNFSIYLRIL